MLPDKKGLSALTGIPVRKIEDLMAKRAIPFLRLGHKTVRFEVAKVLRALNRFEIKEVA